jgi:hypothetical protein
MEFMNGKTCLTTWCGAVVLALAGAGELRAQGKRSLEGLWQYTDPRTQQVVVSVLVLPNGQCQEYGPFNVLEHPNCYRYDGTTLAWCRKQPGMKEFALLTGRVKWVSETQFQFTILEQGYKKQQSGYQDRDLVTRKPGTTWEFKRRLGPAPPQEKPEALVGTWECRNDKGELLTTLNLKAGGPCREVEGGRLAQASSYRYDRGILTLDSTFRTTTLMNLAGTVEWDGKHQFRMEVLFGPYNLPGGTKLICKRQ